MIYTPRIAIDMLLSLAKGQPLSVTNPCVCTVIPFKNFEISISMDSSHGNGNLSRSDIRVFGRDAYGAYRVDVTSNFIEAIGEVGMLYGDAETLLKVMKTAEKMAENKS